MMNRTRANVSPRTLFDNAGKRASVLGAAAALSLLAGLARAQLQGGQVVAGSATITQSGSSTVITAANNTIINFQSFNIPVGTSVQFIQPGATARVLNRITGADPSIIGGSLTANGIVYICNSAGVYFRNGAMVNVGGIYAAAGKISNADFLGNVNRFTGLNGTVENRGTLQGSVVALVGAHAANLGTIVAPQGVVTLAAGSEVYLSDHDKRVMAKVAPAGDPGQTPGVLNAGTISAKGGHVSLGAGDLYAMAIDQRGTITAKDVSLRGGAGGVVSVSGTIDASSTEAGTTGGTIEVLGDKVGIFDGHLDASGPAGGGQILIGGNQQGQGSEPTASATYVSKDAVVRADATEAGNGGRIIVWSNLSTRVYGTLSARGGVLGGDGGFVETSGGWLSLSGAPDLRSPRGRGGHWLIDPHNLDITNNATSGTVTHVGNVFTSGADGDELFIGDLLTALTGGTSVTVQTGAGGAEVGRLRLMTNLDFNGVGAASLTMIAHDAIEINGTISDSVAGGDSLNLTLTATTTVTVNNSISLGGGSFSATGTGITLKAAIDAGAGDVTFGAPVTLGANTTIAAHNITFSGTVDTDGTAWTLGVTSASGTTTFGDLVGNANALGTVTVTGGATAINANVTTTGAQSYGAVTLGGAGTRTLTGTDLTLGAVTGGAHSLTLAGTGTVTLSGAVTGVAALDTSAATTTAINADVTTTGAQIYGDVSLGGAGLRTLTGTNITLGAITGNAHTFALAGTGTVTLGGAVTGVASLTSTTATSTVINADVTTTGSQSYGAVSLGGAGTRTLTGTSLSLGAVTGNAHDFTLAGTGTVTLSGAVTGVGVLDSTTATSTAINANVTTTGAQSYGAVSLGGAGTRTLTGTDITLGVVTGNAHDFTLAGTGTVTLGGAVSGVGVLTSTAATETDINANVTTTGAQSYGDVSLGGAGTRTLTGTSITLGAVTGNAHNFTLAGTGTVTLGGAVTGVGVLTSTTATSTAINADVTTTGAQSYGAVSLGGAGTRTLTGTDLTLGAVTGNAHSLTLAGTGTVTLSGAVSGVATLDSTAATSTAINADVTTTGTQSYGDVSLGGTGARTLTATNITLGVVTGNAHDFTLAGTGTVTLNGAVSGVGVLTSTTAASTAINDDVTTTGAQSYGAVALGGAGTRTLTGTSITLGVVTGNVHDFTLAGTGTVTFGGAVSGVGILTSTTATSTAINADVTTTGAQSYGAIALGGAGTRTLTGTDLTLGAVTGNAHSLTLAGTGTVTLGGAISGVATLTSTAATETDINANVTTTGAQVYGDIALGGTGARTLTGTNLTLGAVTGNSHDLTLIGSGTTTLGGAVSGVGALSTDAAGTTVIGTTTVSAGSYSFLDDVQIQNDLTLSGTSITFGKTLNSSGGSFSLTANATTTVFGGSIGNTGAIVTLTTDAAGTTTIGTAGANSTLNLTTAALGDNVLIAGGVTMTATSATFSGNVNSTGAPAGSLTVNSPLTVFGGSIGNGAALASLTTDATGNTRFNGTGVTVTGTLNLQDDVLLNNNVTFAGTTVAFGKTINNFTVTARTLTVNATTTTFGGVIGNSGALSSLTTDAAGTTTIGGSATAISVSGVITFNDNVLIGANTALTSTGGVFNGTVNNAAGAARTLTLNITNLTLNGAVGDSAALGSLVTAGGSTATLAGPTLSAGTFTFGGDVVLAANIDSLTATTTATFAGKINSQASQHFNLFVDAPTATFQGRIGEGTGVLGNFAVSSSVGTIVSTDLIRADSASFFGAVTLNQSLTVDAGATGTVDFGSTVDSATGLARTLTVNAQTTSFGGVVGGAAGGVLGSLTTDAVGTTSVGADINATTTHFQDDVVLTDNAAFAGTTLTFDKTVASSPGTGFDLTVNAAGTTFLGDVGAGSGALGAFTSGGGTVTTLGAANFSGASLTFNGDLVLNVDAVLTGSTDVTFAAGIASATGAGRGLTVNSPATAFNGVFGTGTARLGLLRTDAAGTTTISKASVDAATVDFLDAIDLAASTTINAGSVHFGGAVSSTAGGVSLDVNGTATVDGGSVSTSGSQTWNGAVTLGADATFDGAGVSFLGDVSSTGGARNLTVNTAGAGLTRFATLGAAGGLNTVITNADGTTALGGNITAITLDFGDAVRLDASVTINAPQSLFRSTVDSATGAGNSLTLNSSSVILDGAVGTGTGGALGSLSTSGSSSTQLGGGTYNAASITFGSGVLLKASTTISGGTVTFNGTVDTLAASSSLTINSNAVINGGSIFTSLGDQTYNGAVTLGADTTLNGAAITLGGAVDSAGAARSLTITNTGVATFGGRVGGTHALNALSVSGQARLGNDIDTAGGMTFGGAVSVFADSVLNDTGATGVRFNNTIDSQTGAHALSVFVAALTAYDPNTPQVPLIVLGGNIGSTTALSSLTLGADVSGSSIAPLATIVGLQDLTVNAVDFTMGQGQKLAVFGTLNLNLSGTAHLGDVSVLNDLSVTAAAIDIRSRANTAIFGPTTLDFITFTVKDAGTDHGTDLVAGGSINFSVAPTVSGGGVAAVSTAGTIRITGAGGNVVQQVFNGSVTLDSLKLKNSANLVAFDLKADGPTTTNVSSSLAGAIPRETQTGQITADTVVGKAERDELTKLGVYARSLDQTELLDFLSGRAFYLDVPQKLSPQGEDYKVAVNRLPGDIVLVVLQTYRDIFSQQSVDPQGRPVRDPSHVGDVIAAGWAEYAAGGTPDPAGFQAFLARTPAQSEAANYVSGLHTLFIQLEYLGLTPLELQVARSQLCAAVAKKGITPQQLETAVMAAAPATPAAGATQ